ncbi:DNA-binding response regulator [Cnuibacter physcomitrellae]|uniref:DNA-binding response regulator n=1 Tax=Cnuibacter physcomitrellae TaxID=1619308 RepID=A0A1X9LIT7_9MICO|nr:response regulator transcription factor [Cnuibacter physcomitrellae]ARJ04412.1 DNA-binding response regulator [Cnuibacter physcomitrellae]GGI40988.1 DNA-binding response regulator [Cnuibacter physcomitrellae]
MSDVRRIGLLLVDDQPLIRMGLRMVLEARGFAVVGEASDGGEAIAQAAALAPDVILMDVRMPGLDGIQATRAIVHASPGSRILILTTFDLDEYAFAALDAGASGFLLKDAQPTELAAAIEAVATGDAAVSPRVTRRLLDIVSGRLSDAQGGAAGSAASGGAPPAVDPDTAARLGELTEREREVLVAMAEGLTNSEIASRLFLSESTVKTHVGRVLMKLDARDRVQAVILALRAGLVSL